MANPLLGWVAGASPQTLERLQSYRVPVDADPLAILRTLEKDGGRWPEVDADAASLRSLIRAELSAAQEMRAVLREHQWSGEHHHEDSDGGYGYPVCPECGNGVPGPKWDAPAGLGMGHSPDCRLARLIGETK